MEITSDPFSNLTTSGPFSPTNATPVLSITPPDSNLGIFPTNSPSPLGIFILDFTPSRTLSFKGDVAPNGDSSPLPLTSTPVLDSVFDLVISPTPFLNISSKDFKNFLFCSSTDSFLFGSSFIPSFGGF